jgi:hypothetical protein
MFKVGDIIKFDTHATWLYEVLKIDVSSNSIWLDEYEIKNNKKICDRRNALHGLQFCLYNAFVYKSDDKIINSKLEYICQK